MSFEVVKNTTLARGDRSWELTSNVYTRGALGWQGVIKPLCCSGQVSKANTACVKSGERRQTTLATLMVHPKAGYLCLAGEDRGLVKPVSPGLGCLENGFNQPGKLPRGTRLTGAKSSAAGLKILSCVHSPREGEKGDVTTR